MLNQFSRTELLIGKKGVEKLQNSRIAIFGIGGVGSFVVEGLVRAGVSNFVLIDHDTIDLTNLNRQIHSTHKTIGKYKVDVMKERILDINPNAKVTIYKEFYLPNCQQSILDNSIDYIVDAVDTVTAKLEIISNAKKLNIPVISAMGTGNKLDPAKLVVTDIYKTSICPLAKIMRKELRARNISNLKVLYSTELPIVPDSANNVTSVDSEITLERKKITPGSISFVPSVGGLIISGEVIKDLLNLN